MGREADGYKATLSFGAKKDKSKPKEYELLLDDAVAFVMHKTVTGDMKGKSSSTIEKERRMNLKETKEDLPIFAYKVQLLEAIGNHQVLIIKGETGSEKTMPLKYHSTSMKQATVHMERRSVVHNLEELLQ